MKKLHLTCILAIALGLVLSACGNTPISDNIAKEQIKLVPTVVNFTYSHEAQYILKPSDRTTKVANFATIMYLNALGLSFDTSGINEIQTIGPKDIELFRLENNWTDSSVDMDSCNGRDKLRSNAEVVDCFNQINNATIDVTVEMSNCDESYPGFTCAKDNLTMALDMERLTFTVTGTVTDHDREMIEQVLVYKNIPTSILPSVILAEANYSIDLP